MNRRRDAGGPANRKRWRVCGGARCLTVQAGPLCDCRVKDRKVKESDCRPWSERRVRTVA